MARKQIIWSSTAEESIKSIIEYYDKTVGNSKYSKALINRINNFISLLQENPLLGKLSSDKKVRVFVIKYYKVYYEISDSIIRILAVWDTRRNPKDLKKLLN